MKLLILCFVVSALVEGAVSEIAVPSNYSTVFQLSQSDLRISQEIFPPIDGITGLARDSEGYLYIVQQTRKMSDGQCFDDNNNFIHKDFGPIMFNTIVVLTPTGEFHDAWGAGMFYMPHSIAIDSKNNAIWITDMALHQAFKFDLNEINNRPTKRTKFVFKPAAVIGKAFKPAEDLTSKELLAMPTGIAVLPDGSVVIANGPLPGVSGLYRANSKGEFIQNIRIPQAGRLHAITYDPSNRLILTADKQSIYGITYDTLPAAASYFAKSTTQSMFSPVGLASYQSTNCSKSFLVAIGRSFSADEHHAALFFMDPADGSLYDTVPISTAFNDAHAIVIDSAQDLIYVSTSVSGAPVSSFGVSLKAACPKANTAVDNDNMQPGNMSFFSNGNINFGICNIAAISVISILLLSVVVLAVCLCRLRRRPASQFKYRTLTTDQVISQSCEHTVLP